MGKRNKFSKIGMSRSIFKAMTKEQKKKKNHAINKTKLMAEEDEDEEELENDHTPQKQNLNNTIINEDAVNKNVSILGVGKEELISVLQNPIRHRRAITKVVLSKGQKKRLEKKDRFKNKQKLIERIKLNQTMMNMSTNKTLNPQVDKTTLEATMKNNNFNLLDINHTIENMLDVLKDDQEESKTIHNKFKTHRDKRNFKKILNEEKEKIKKVMQNKNYQANPLEAMKYHIKNAQLIQERNKKIEENFQKNYNFLNLK